MKIERDDTWYDKAAVRRRRLKIGRISLAMPLFAPLVPEMVPERTGAEIRAAEEQLDARAEEMTRAFDERMRARATELRAYVAERVTPEVMAALDAWVAERGASGLRARHLADPTYLADHWHQIRRRVDAGLPAVESDEERLTTSRRMVALGQVSG